MPTPNTPKQRAIDFLKSELVRQAEFAIKIGEDMSDSWVDTFDHNPEELFQSIQNRLHAAATASQILWPGSTQLNARETEELKGWASEIRQAYGFSDDQDRHALGQRSIRDSIYHINERVYKWATTTDVQPFDMNVGSAFTLSFDESPADEGGNRIHASGIPQIAVFRNWGHDELIFWHKRLRLSELVGDLDRIVSNGG